MKTKRRSRIAIAGGFVAVAIFIIAFFAIQNGISGLAATGGMNTQGGTAEAAYTDRPLHNLSPSVFENLPLFPADFYDIDRGVETNSFGFENLPQLEEKYYKQPEFLPTWEGVGVERMKNPPEYRIAIWGLGAYPAEQTLNIRRGEEKTMAVFFHTSWMVQTRQGIELVVEKDDNMEVELETRVFLLGRAYPVFDENWVQKVVVNVKATEDTEPGAYTISLIAKAPPEEYQELWREEHGGLYVNAPSASPDKPFLKLDVYVQ